MTKTTTKLLALFCSIALLIAVMPIVAIDISAKVLSGSCGKEGNNVTYTLDTSSGLLTISGTGEMKDYGLGESGPWGNGIKKAIINKGVTSIGCDAFDRCTSLQSIVLPSGITEIGYCAFCYCSSLQSIILPDSVTRIQAEVFADCKNLQSITIPVSLKKISHMVFYGCNNLQNIYYAGSKIEWQKIEIIPGNDPLLKAPNQNNCKNFPDVPANMWYTDPVNYVVEKGFMSGYQSGKFGPGDKLQRQDFVVILSKIAGADLSKYQNSTGGLKDVVKGSYYAPAVAWAVDNGIVSGYQNGKFGVGDPITREQVCTIFWRYKGSPAVPNADALLSAHKDAFRISDFAKTAMAWAKQNGVISGMADGRIAPVDKASRAQIAVIVTNMDKKGMF
ncbi:MAG: S-layer homology domain-containing protein [Clostridia bacterium]|nr:S-layer homology domain-containing protein [Clostridia bacterium]